MIEPVRDARLIHQMLVQHGYQVEDIRILIDGFDHEFFGANHPIRENILSSLDWLVHEARSTDYRFFHFSGHGQRFLSERGLGKQARRVVPPEDASPNDTELWAQTHDESGVGRIKKQTVRKDELEYYEEAILTRTSYDPKERGKILHRHPGAESEVFGASNRMQANDNSIKLLGDGFRGKINYPVVQGGNQSKIEPPSQLQPGFFFQVSDLFGLIVSQIKAEIEASKDDSMVTMYEKLPSEELALDGIKAEASTWAACHQRQLAAQSYTSRCGLLTQAFTEALGNHPANTPTIEAFFNTV
ncbi:hypothetical protein FRC07_003510, partial [Ceratobasidium sp. 392]